MKYKLKDNIQIDTFEQYIIITKKENDEISLSKAIVLEDISKLIVESIIQNISEEQIIEKIINEYDILKEIAIKDFCKFIKELINIGIIEDGR